MYYLREFCCVCFKYVTKETKTNFTNDKNYYSKLLLVVPEMYFQEQCKKLFCVECCKAIEEIYEFRVKCLRNKHLLKCYVRKLQTISQIRGELRITLSDLNKTKGKSKGKDDIVVQNVEKNSEIKNLQKKIEKTCEIIKKDIADVNIYSSEDQGLSEAQKIEEIELPFFVKEATKEDILNTEIFTVMTNSQRGIIHVGNIDIIRDEEERIEERIEEIEDDEDKLIIDYPQDYIVKNSIANPPKGSSIPLLFIIPSNEEIFGANSTKENIDNNIKVFGKHKCNICCEYFFKLADLKSHLKNDCKPYECRICGKKFVRKAAYTVHLKLHEKKCKICNITFSNVSNLETHEKIHAREYFCRLCNESFNEKSVLELHLASHDSRPFKCPTCAKSFKFKSSLTRHISTHSGVRSHKCTICDNSYSDESYLDTHMRMHTGVRIFRCTICKMTFKDWVSRFKHRVTHH